MGVSSGIIAKSLLTLSRLLQLNEYLISFFLISIVTSIPGIFITFASIIAKVPAISVGNILGANLANITISIGLVSLFANGIEIPKNVSSRIFWASFLIALLPSILIQNGGITRFDVIILIFIFLAYSYVFSRDAGFLEKTVPHIPYRAHFFTDTISSLTHLFFGLIILTLSCFFIVIFGTGLATYLSIDLIFFGTIFLGLITTLPELFFGIKSAILRHPALAMGNILGSIVFNATISVALIAFLSPTIIGYNASPSFILSCIFLLIAFIFLGIFSYSNSRISRSEGVLLISIYILFAVTLFVIR